MLIVALVLAVIGLASLVTAVVTSNELIAWVCIAASVIGVLLLIIDAIRDRQSRDRVAVEADHADGAQPTHSVDETYETFDAEYPADAEPARVDADAVDADEDFADDTRVERVTDVSEETPDDVERVAAVDPAVDEVHHATSEESDGIVESVEDLDDPK